MNPTKILAAAGLLALAVSACGSAVPAGSTGTVPAASSVASPSAVPANATPITVKDFSLEPNTLAVRGTVSLAVTNAGPTVHNVTIRDSSGKVLGATADLKPGEAATLTADLPGGTYTMFCSLPGHESLGVKGPLTVTK
ncbi:MAG: cupredoxin domain-containing protein [Chloroflexota bacterium]